MSKESTTDCKDQKFMGFYESTHKKKVDLVKMFDTFWKEHPKKVGKGYARKCFKRALKRVSFAKMMVAHRKQQKADMWTKDNGKFVPNPSTWLNQDRWEDELPHKETIAEKHARLKEKGEI